MQSSQVDANMLPTIIEDDNIDPDSKAKRAITPNPGYVLQKMIHGTVLSPDSVDVFKSELETVLNSQVIYIYIYIYIS